MEDLDVLGVTIIQAPFERDVINICTRLIAVRVSIGAHLTPNDNIESVGEEVA